MRRLVIRKAKFVILSFTTLLLTTLLASTVALASEESDIIRQTELLAQFIERVNEEGSVYQLARAGVEHNELDRPIIGLWAAPCIETGGGNFLIGFSYGSGLNPDNYGFIIEEILAYTGIEREQLEILHDFQLNEWTLANFQGEDARDRYEVEYVTLRERQERYSWPTRTPDPRDHFYGYTHDFDYVVEEKLSDDHLVQPHLAEPGWDSTIVFKMGDIISIFSLVAGFIALKE